VTRLNYRLAASPAQARREDVEATTLVTRREADLEHVGGDVQAVVYVPPSPPWWLADLADAVESGRLHFERIVLACATATEIAAWFEASFPRHVLAPSVRRAVKEDVLWLVRRAGATSRTSHVMFRAHTDAPSRRCGFHVDTVPAGAPTVGYLRVYNGAGTDYVEPRNVSSIGDFYRHLSRRERLVRAWAQQPSERLLAELRDLDERPEFLVEPDDVRVAPAGAAVAFVHLDVRLHWSDHPKRLAWIHRSPMTGAPRLVVNVAAREPRLFRRAR
jgi:hypothetical protein